MARYYFDIDDGDVATEDDDGTELQDLAEARHHAIAVLPNLARDVLPNGDRREFKVTLRDASGRRVFRASLMFRADWLIDPTQDG
ncbi:MAG: hypothetical protein AB7O49_15740 [Sphingomonadales bacterium]